MCSSRDESDRGKHPRPAADGRRGGGGSARRSGGGQTEEHLRQPALRHTSLEEARGEAPRREEVGAEGAQVGAADGAASHADRA